MSQNTEHVDNPQDITPNTDIPLTEGNSENTAETPLSELEQAQQTIVALQEKQEQLIRSVAEAENMRRRAEESAKKAREYALESFAPAILPVMDSLQAALTQGGDLEKLKEGVAITEKQLQSAFEKAKLVAIDPLPGDKMDPLLHQTMGSMPSEYPNNHVASVLQKGYRLSERVIRPAFIMVSQKQD